MASGTRSDEPRLAEATEHRRLPEHDAMSTLVGKWITVGETIPTDGAPALEIRTSDVYEWVPGGFFVVHIAYGRIGDADVGGVELIGYDPEAKKYRAHFFDSQGNVSEQDLSFSDGTWIWSGEHVRATGTLIDDGRTMPTLHEWSEDGVNWRPSMGVTLRKVI